MRKFKRIFVHENRGFTLVEMIISLAIISIMMMGMLAFFGPVTQMTSDMKKVSHSETAIVNINTYISKSIRDAKKVVIYQYYNYNELPSAINLTGSIPYSDSKDEIKCLRLAWTKRIGSSYGYILIDEKIDATSTVNNVKIDSKNYTSESVPEEKKVFKDGYYKDLNFLFEIKDVIAADNVTILTDGCALSAVAYEDATFKNQIFSSDNTMDYIIFNNIRINESIDGFVFNKGVFDKDSRDIFIFYIVSKSETSPTP